MTAELTNLYEIVTPLATINLGSNPSLETGTTKWSAVGTAAAIARDNTQARFGRYSLKITTGTDVLGGGYYYTAGAGISVSVATAYAASFYVYNPDGDIRLSVRDNADVELAVSATIPASTKWKRVTLAVTTGGASTTVHFRITNDNSGVSHVCYVDGVQFEQLAAASTYCDGDQPGCFWDGTIQASPSQRDAFGIGGQIQNLNDLGIGVEMSSGFGMPSLTQRRQALAQIPGSVYEEAKILERSAQMVLDAEGASLTNLHKLRSDLMDTIKPDRVSSPVPFRITYLGADERVYGDFVYEDGMKGGKRSAFFESFAIRLLATDPFMYEDRQEISLPSFTQSLTRAKVMRRRRGEWGFPTAAGADNNTVFAIASAPDGRVYLGGSFTGFNSVADTDRVVAILDGVATALDGAIDNGQVNAIAVAPDGTVYIGGTFTTVNTGTTVNRICSYDPAADTFATMGATPGVNGEVKAIAIGLDGLVYIAGDFTDEGNRICTWDGSVFADPFGTGSATILRALAVSPEGDLFIGGDHTSFNAVSGNRIHKWSVADAVATAVGGNGQLNAECRALAFAPDGRLYAGGDFTTASGNTVNRIAIWGGSDWLAMESGVDADVHSLAWIDGLLWLGGAFTVTGASPALALPRLGVWNGSAFVRSDITLPSTPIVYAIAGQGEDVYIGHDTAGASTLGVLNVVTNNGTAAAYPVLVFTGPGTLKWIENFTDRRRLFFDLEAQAGEEITIDFGPSSKRISSNWRVAALQPLPGSDFAAFRLLPGANDITAFITDSTGATELHLRWQITHWSRDGASS